MSVFIDNGEPGTWAAVMPFLRNVRFLPDVPLKGLLNAVEGGGQRLPAFTPVVPCLHATPSKPGGQPDRV